MCGKRTLADELISSLFRRLRSVRLVYLLVRKMVVIVPRNTEIVRKFLKYRTTRWSCALEKWNKWWKRWELITTWHEQRNIHNAIVWIGNSHIHLFYLRRSENMLICVKTRIINRLFIFCAWKRLICKTVAGLRTIFHEYYYGNMRYSHVMAVRDRRVDICMLVTRPSTSAACNFWVWLLNNGACKF